LGQTRQQEESGQGGPRPKATTKSGKLASVWGQ